MGFIEMQNSRISFPDKYAEKNYSFASLDSKLVKSAPDSLMMVFNLERQAEEEDSLQRKHEYHNMGSFNESNGVIAGDLATMIDSSNERVNDGTISTGAETPFSFFGSDSYGLGIFNLK